MILWSMFSSAFSSVKMQLRFQKAVVCLGEGWRKPSESLWNDPTHRAAQGGCSNTNVPQGEVQVIRRTTEAPSIKGLLTLQLWSSNSCSQGAVVCAPEFPSHQLWETRGTALRVHLFHQWILGSIFQKNCPNSAFFLEKSLPSGGKGHEVFLYCGCHDARYSTTSPACSVHTNSMREESNGCGKFFSASSSATHSLALRSIYSLRFNSAAHHYLRASSVLLFSEGLLGSPIPIRLAATTRNSYSTQGFKPTTVAVNVLPSMISGTRREPQVRSATKVTKGMESHWEKLTSGTLKSEGLTEIREKGLINLYSVL